MAGKWIAKRDQNTGERFVHAGEDCPEAASWPNLRAYVNAGYVAWVEIPDEPSPALAPTTPAAAAVAPEVSHPPDVQAEPEVAAEPAAVAEAAVPEQPFVQDQPIAPLQPPRQQRRRR